MADAVIYPVLIVPITNDAGRNVGGENALTTLSLRTGGRVFAASLGAALDQSFDQILRDLRTQYLLAFYPRGVPPTKERFHALDISLAAPTAEPRIAGESAQWILWRGSVECARRSGRIGAGQRFDPGPQAAAAKPTQEFAKLTWHKPRPKSSRPSEQTFEEIKYLKHLIEQKTPICVKLSDNEEVRGVIEYYDQRFIRITRAGAPNLFIFKHDIKYLYEVA